MLTTHEDRPTSERQTADAASRSNGHDPLPPGDAHEPRAAEGAQGSSESFREFTVRKLRTLGALALLTAIAPLNLSVVAIAWLTSLPVRSPGTARRTVLISGGKMTKALTMCRAFRAAGWRVILCETPKYWLAGNRFSRAVDRFRLTPELTDRDYAAGLAKIAREEQACLYLPVCSPAASRYDSAAIAAMPASCEVLHVGPHDIEMLDNKYELSQAARRLGLPTPVSHHITSSTQVDHESLGRESRPYILKSIRYDAFHRLDLTKLPRPTEEATKRFVEGLPIAPENPWVLQEFIAGEEFCTHSTVRDGKLLVHTCCRSSEFQVNYEHLDVPEIDHWVKTFVEAHRLTGQVSFDFIRANNDGHYYAIECNPRPHSAITAFHRQHREFAEAIEGGAGPDRALTPLDTARPTYWLYHELWRLATSVFSPSRFAERLRVVLRGRDAIFAWRDPLPFFMVHHLQLPLLLLQDLVQQRGWIRIDFNIGKLVQPAGD